MKQDLSKCSAYTVKVSKQVQELNGVMSILEHNKTKAKICVIENNDENKVFCVGFRTPPKDSTGIPHILEHSVLCGSRKYPVKEPFVELAKGSLCNFVNAMTYPDKTIYPIASTNLQDYKNATSVYCDAVFHPNIYSNPFIFQQEGWHYEVDDKDELTINGVVYNEMKGVFSNPEDCLFEYVCKSCFPNTCYGVVSGGDPDVIPELTYEQFINFHQTYYHPSNSYIYFYGDCDMVERLEWLDKEVLSEYDYLTIDSTIGRQEPFDTIKASTYYYNLDDEESLDNKDYLSLNTVVDIPKDCAHLFAFKVLSYILVDSNAALLKQALLKAGIGKDIMGGFQDGIYQPLFIVIAKHAAQHQLDAFKHVINATLQEIVNNGLNHQDCIAALNAIQFSTIETTSLPKGLDNGVAILDAWLYDDDPFAFVQYQQSFEVVRNWINEGKLEQLIQTYLLDSTFTASVTLIAKHGYQAEKQAQLRASLDQLKQSLTTEQFNAIKENTKALKAFQQKENTPEELATLPMLTKDDLSSDIMHFEAHPTQILNTPIIYSINDQCNGITYISQYFDLSKVDNALLPYVSLYIKCLGKMDTNKYSYDRLDTEILTISGGCEYRFDVFSDMNDSFEPYTYLGIKVFKENILRGLNLMQHIACHTCFNDKNRLSEVINQLFVGLQSDMMASAHLTAYQHMNAYLNKSSAFMELIGGYDFYLFVKNVVKAFETDDNVFIDDMLGKFAMIQKQLFTQDNLMMHYTCASYDKDHVDYCIETFIKECEYAPKSQFDAYFNYQSVIKNEAFITPGSVNYVGQVGKMDVTNFNMGRFMVLKNVLNYGYLWNKVRVDGGAYGVFNIINRKGYFSLVSYRDPHIDHTYQVYADLAQAIEQLELSDDDLLKNIIGTIGALDSPVGAKEYGVIALRYYLSKVDESLLKMERQAILSVSNDALRKCSGLVKSALSQGVYCTVGAKETIEKDKHYFKDIKPLM